MKDMVETKAAYTAPEIESVALVGADVVCASNIRVETPLGDNEGDGSWI